MSIHTRCTALGMAPRYTFLLSVAVFTRMVNKPKLRACTGKFRRACSRACIYAGVLVRQHPWKFTITSGVLAFWHFGMSAPVRARPGAPTRQMFTMRPPPARPGASRAQTATPTLHSRASPADSMLSSKQRTPKRKAQSEQPDQDGGEETNIHVVVRCRGRNDREVRENSGVVVSTDGVKGKTVELSMGPNALSNKAYHFDKVFSPAADQGIVFDEVVAPILDEVRS